MNLNFEAKKMLMNAPILGIFAENTKLVARYLVAKVESNGLVIFSCYIARFHIGFDCFLKVCIILL